MRADEAVPEVSAVDSPLRADYMAALTDPDALRRQARAHLTASAVVLSPDGAEVLLVLHRKVGLWLQPGGHVDETDRTLAGAALREATEETGLADLQVDPVAVALDRHRAPCGADWHLDVQFRITAPARAEPVVSEESLAVRWWPVHALPEQPVDLRPLVLAALRQATLRQATLRQAALRRATA